MLLLSPNAPGWWIFVGSLIVGVCIGMVWRTWTE
jgi:hypothetical protein